MVTKGFTPQDATPHRFALLRGARRSIFLGGSDDTGLILSESITLDSITNANELVSVIQHLPENTTLVKVFGDES